MKIKFLALAMILALALCAFPLMTAAANDVADYTAVDSALAKVAAMNPDHYYDFSKVDAAVKKVVREKPASEQAAVDFMAINIESAIGFLDMKPADYTAVDAAVAAAEKLDKTSYKDFSAVEAAIEAVQTGKKINEQAAVDAMAQAINDAVAGLESINPATSDVAVALVAVAAVASVAVAFCVAKKREA